METRKRNLPTLEDVANAAGVSTATVSRCLNEPDKVSGGTRDRVMAAVDKLHYSPNFGARAIAANRTGIVGVVIPTMVNAIFARGVEAFQKTIVANKKTMLVASSSYDRTQEIDQIRTMVARGAEGMLLIGTDRDPDVYSFLSQRNIPVVIAWARTSDPDQSFVGFSNKDASKRLTEKAIALGHRSFGYISAYRAMNDRARYRVAGAKEALVEAGLDPDSMQLIETKYSLKCARTAFHEMQQSSPRPTIIMCGNDVLAVGAIQAAQDAGMKVPDDISITGYDDIEISSVIKPAVTTVHVPHRKMGRLAAEALISLVEGASNPIRIELETHIVERDSLGEPKI